MRKVIIKARQRFQRTVPAGVSILLLLLVFCSSINALPLIDWADPVMHGSYIKPATDFKRIDFEKRADGRVEQLVNDLMNTAKDLAKNETLSLETKVPKTTAFLDEVDFLGERFKGGLQAVAKTILLGFPEGDVTEYKVNNTLSYLLLQSSQPSVTGAQNPFVGLTKNPTMEVKGMPGPVSQELALAMKVADYPGSYVEPKDLLKMAVEVCKGDYPAATLVAHNFLKEVAYSKRDGIPSVFSTLPIAGKNLQQTKEMVQKYKDAMSGYQLGFFDPEGPPAGIGPKLKRKEGDFYTEVAVGLGDPKSDYLSNKLAQLRVEGDPHLGDKMGPWYHIFGVLHLSSVAKGGRLTAKTWAEAENLLRHAPGFSSGPDYFKELMNSIVGGRCGEILDEIEKNMPPDPPPPPNPPSQHIVVNNEKKDWFCTNRPDIETPMPISPLARKQ